MCIKNKDTAAGHDVTRSKRKSFKPKAAGNKAFKLHNNMRFARTSEKRELGRQNKIIPYE